MTTTVNKTIGDRIRDRRESLGLSQEELAKMLGYSSRSSINKIEKGAQQLRQTKLKAIADALDTTVNYILGIDAETEKINNIWDNYVVDIQKITENLNERQINAALESTRKQLRIYIEELEKLRQQELEAQQNMKLELQKNKEEGD